MRWYEENGRESPRGWEIAERARIQRSFQLRAALDAKREAREAAERAKRNARDRARIERTGRVKKRDHVREAAVARARKQDRFARGLCTVDGCLGFRHPKRTRCTQHLQLDAARVKKHADARHAEGLCVKCKTPKQDTTRRRCQACYDRDAQDKRDRKARRRAIGLCATCCTAMHDEAGRFDNCQTCRNADQKRCRVQYEKHRDKILPARRRCRWCHGTIPREEIASKRYCTPHCRWAAHWARRKGRPTQASAETMRRRAGHLTDRALRSKVESICREIDVGPITIPRIVEQLGVKITAKRVAGVLKSLGFERRRNRGAGETERYWAPPN